MRCTIKHKVRSKETRLVKGYYDHMFRPNIIETIKLSNFDAEKAAEETVRAKAASYQTLNDSFIDFLKPTPFISTQEVYGKEFWVYLDTVNMPSGDLANIDKFRYDNQEYGYELVYDVDLGLMEIRLDKMESIEDDLEKDSDTTKAHKEYLRYVSHYERMDEKIRETIERTEKKEKESFVKANEDSNAATRILAESLMMLGAALVSLLITFSNLNTTEKLFFLAFLLIVTLSGWLVVRMWTK